jgi:prepilin-type N-terminal cleavage/methylation domain-containing protein
MFIGPHNATNPPSPRLRQTGRRIRLRWSYGGRVGESANRRGFTLLEIMLAVTILGMMSLAIFRFVQANLVALYISSDTQAADAQYDGLRDLLTVEWQNLSPLRAAMAGESFKLSERQRDEVKWRSTAGPGLLTRYAPGDFTITLRLQPDSGKGKQLNLGILRRSQEDSEKAEATETWVPLIRNVTSLEIHYFDSNTNDWVAKWPSGGRLPWLIKLEVGRPDSAVPWEAIIPLRRTPY